MAAFHPAVSQNAPPDFQMSCGTMGAAPSASPASSPGFLPICTDPNAVRYLRVAFHYLLRESNYTWTFLDDCADPDVNFTYIGPGNFTESSDGYQNSVYNGFLRAEEVIADANAKLAANWNHWRKAPGVYYPPTTNLPATNIRYVLVGTYFHRDNAAYIATESNRFATQTKYNIGGETVLDVYFTPNGNWSGIASAIGGTNKFVFMNCYKKYLEPDCRNWSLQYEADLLNHEIGHTLDLSHTWNENDLCDDTPVAFMYDKIQQPPATPCVKAYAECWGFDASKPGCPLKPCDDWGKITNNVMDYNGNPKAYTLCQVARVRAELLASSGNSYIHSCNGCLPSNAFFFMHSEQSLCEEVLLGPAIVLNGQGSFNENKYLIEICELATPTSTTCYSNYYSSGWMNGKIARVNLAALYGFKKDTYYKVKLTVDNTDCPGSTSYEKTIHLIGCTTSGSVDFVVQNPFSDQLAIHYTTTQPGKVTINLIHTYTGQFRQLMAPTDLSAGDYQLDLPTGGLPSGMYAVQVLFNGQVQSKNTVKP